MICSQLSSFNFFLLCLFSFLCFDLSFTLALTPSHTTHRLGRIVEGNDLDDVALVEGKLVVVLLRKEQVGKEEGIYE